MYGEPTFTLDAEKRVVHAAFSLNGGKPAIIGYQIYDPDTATFILEGAWQRFEPGPVSVDVTLPPERGHYHVYLSPQDEKEEWYHSTGKPFLLIDAFVEGGHATLIDARETTTRSLRTRNFVRSFGKAFTLPVRSIHDNLSLIRSMVRRDILSRYRGSFGDVVWTVLNPLLLMAAYSFVFGFVLKARFGADTTSTGFILYFLAGMLPWLAFSESVGRAPHVLLEHRNFIRKLVFPVEILPVTQTLAALVTQGIGLAIFLVMLLFIRGGIPVTALWLPALLIPQILFTLGIGWFLSALGVFMRDLSQIIGLILTLWFFLTPIGYPETSLPEEAAVILRKNPIYALVRGYRAIFLENAAPPFSSLWKLWLIACVVFVLGHAWFYKLRRSFADVI